MKNKKNIVLVLVLGLALGFMEYRVQQAEKKMAFVASHAMGNSQLANQAMMMVQTFYDIAPQEIVELVANTKCNCGLHRPRITIASESNDSSHDDSR